MADTQSRENGAHAFSGSGKRKQAVADETSATPALLKKMKMESDAPPEANPNTMEAVKEKNRAMELELREKNRRIAYLSTKCEALYRGRAVADTSFRCVRRQWLQLHDDLASTLHAMNAERSATENASDGDEDEWRGVLDAVECFGLLRTQPADLQIFLPEWFLAISKIDAEQQDEEAAEQTSAAATGNHAANNGDDGCDDAQDGAGGSGNAIEYVAKEDLAAMESQMHEQLVRKHADTKQLLQQILRVVASHQPAAATVEFKKIVQEKRAAVAQALALKDQLQTYQARIQELEKDVQMKEVERHRACRDFDRLSKYVEKNDALVDPAELAQAAAAASAASAANGNVDDGKLADEDKKQSLTALSEAAAKTAEEIVRKDKTIAALCDDREILGKKLYQERAIIAELRKDVEKLRATESAWKKEEAAMKQEFEDKLQHVVEEKNQINEAFSKIHHKAKDIETHVNEKWKKKMARIQAEMTKVKTQMDELNLKNVAFREKLSTLAASRDQLHELKSLHEVLKSENATLKTQVDRERLKNEQSANLSESQEVLTLTEKVRLLEKSKKELEESYAALKQASSGSTDGDKLSSLVRRQSELDARYEQELLEHSATKTAVESLRLEIEALKATEAASREENDALISEIDTISKEMESVRQGRKKLVQQVEEKRNSNKRLHTQLSKEEQAKAHCFEELAAARLQVSSLGTVHKQQKTYIESVKESLHAKEKELEALKEFVKNLSNEREATDSEKRKIMREAEVAKQIYTTSMAELSQRKQQQLQEQKKPCEKCEAYKKKEERYEKQLQAAAAKATPATGELNDLERFELKELQKLVNCSVCQDNRKNVLIGKCFHMFCRDCVDSNLKSRNRKCPTCKTMFGQDDVKAVWFT